MGLLSSLEAPMALFRRRATPDETVDGSSPAEASDAAEDAAEADDSPEPSVGAGAPRADRTGGPFDATEADLADQDLPRLDLGALRIPGLPGIGVQVEADPNTQEVRAVTGVAGDGAVQLQAFAAPRSEGLWDEIRAEMLAEIQSTSGATVSEVEGPFGPELRAVVPARSPEGKQVLQPLRFVGIDGPRWFLRSVFLGRAAVEPDPDDALHTLVRQTIVVRGADAMAPRDPLPLRLPEQPPTGMAADGTQGPTQDDAEVADDADDLVDDDDTPSRYADLDPFQRGPEITEIR
jgi:hypothetical protein